MKTTAVLAVALLASSGVMAAKLGEYNDGTCELLADTCEVYTDKMCRREFNPDSRKEADLVMDLLGAQLAQSARDVEKYLGRCTREGKEYFGIKCERGKLAWGAFKGKDC